MRLRLWSGFDGKYSTNYVNDRNQSWGYDEAGNATTQETLTAKYNSAGQRSSTTAPARHIGSQTVNLKLSEGYDGDGQQVAETQTITVGTNPPSESTKYKIRSSLLGGQIIDEANGTGAKSIGYVYANGQLIARQQVVAGTVVWEHFSPTNLSERWTNTSGQMTGASEYDPAHSAVGTEDPGPGPDGTPPDLLYPRNGDPTDLSGGCMIDGMVAPCSVAMSLVNAGAGVATDPYETPSGVAPILWTKGPQAGQTGFAVFHAYADGFSLFVPTNGRYAGDGRVQVYTVTDREVRKDKHGTLEIEYWGWIAVTGLQQASQPTGDCATFADLVEGIAKKTIGSRPDTPGLDVQLFMDRLATTFTEFSAARFFAVVGAGTIEPINTGQQRFGSSGFARQFFEPNANQVRHAVGGLIAGYVGISLARMNAREDPNDPLHGVPDINLNGQTVPMGARLGATGYQSIALNRRGVSNGAEAARGLADWIRSILCGN